MSAPQLQRIVDRFFSGEISAPVTMMELLLRTRDAEVVASTLPRLEGDPNKLAELRALFAEHAVNCARIADVLKAEIDVPVGSGDSALERVRRQFDTIARTSEEASVALYSLGSPSLLAEATLEVLVVLERWGVLEPNRQALEIGCGIGRFLGPLATRLRRVVGIDISSEMLAAARVRLRGIHNVELHQTNGRDLSRFDDDSFGLVYAIDVLPYLVEAGPPFVEMHFQEVARVLTAGGDFVIFNYAYGRTNEDTLREVGELADKAGLSLERAGESPFRLWNATGFLLRKAVH